MGAWSKPICGVGLVAFESNPELLFPTFITRFNTDSALQLTEDAEMVEFEIEPVGVDLTAIHLPVFSHVTCDCKPETTQYVHTVNPTTVVSFFSKLATTRCFVWIVSTPTKEVRLLVQTSDNTIIKRHERARTLQ